MGSDYRGKPTEGEILMEIPIGIKLNLFLSFKNLSHLLHQCLSAAWPSKQRKSSDNARADIIILGLGVAVASELWRLSQQTTTKPRTMSLSLVSDNLNLQSTGFGSTATRFRCSNAGIN